MVTVNSFDDYVSDLDMFIREIVMKREGRRPLYLYGHSMGDVYKRQDIGRSATTLPVWPFTVAYATRSLLRYDKNHTGNIEMCIRDSFFSDSVSRYGKV